MPAGHRKLRGLPALPKALEFEIQRRWQSCLRVWAISPIARIRLTASPDVFQIREALEGIVARDAAGDFPRERLHTLRGYFEDLRIRLAAGDDADVGDQIHGEILSACQNAELATLMGKYREMISWFQRLASQVPGRLVDAYREHEAILCAIEAGDGEWAERAARAHVRNTLRDLLPLLSEAPLDKARPRRRAHGQNLAHST